MRPSDLWATTPLCHKTTGKVAENCVVSFFSFFGGGGQQDGVETVLQVPYITAELQTENTPFPSVLGMPSSEELF